MEAPTYTTDVPSVRAECRWANGRALGEEVSGDSVGWRPRLRGGVGGGGGAGVGGPTVTDNQSVSYLHMQSEK